MAQFEKDIPQRLKPSVFSGRSFVGVKTLTYQPIPFKTEHLRTGWQSLINRGRPYAVLRWSYSSCPIDVHRKPYAEWLFSQEKATLHEARKGTRIGELL
ncbi:MAG: hypothetical protein WBE38_17810 [Terracidiphilus sp.]